MSHQGQTVDLTRRKPTQVRALDTVEIILEATARILQKQGPAALNTNYIAERAGISVGTLYQYFANKEAILVAMARREIATDEAAVIKAMSEVAQGSDIDPVRLAMRALITAFGKRRVARRVAFEALFSEGMGNELATSVQKVAQMAGERSDRLLPARTRPVTPTNLFIITRAISGIMRAASQEESPLLGTPEFEDELVHLVQAYFAASS
ncbi:MAG TPA: TetR/AcrR family transcriptional regulator [Candidatus Angelobacter sp.]|jgi:AcrR family transcriptional regulator|nr:TetR/AcrR family transcriptional regulator [Candidatus Angelobacter sp.]